MLPRKLAHKDRFVYYLIQQLSGDCTGEPIQFPDDTTKIKFVVEMNQNEFTKLYASLLTGADLSYPEEAHDITMILLRQLECPVSICAEITECLTPLFEAIEAQITAVQTQLDAIQSVQSDNAAQEPVPVMNAVTDAQCGGATFVVEAMNAKNMEVFNAAEAGFIDNLFEMIPVVIEAIPGIGSLPFDELFEVVNWYFENQVTQYETDYAAIKADLICDLRCFVEANDDTFDTLTWQTWLEYVGATYPTNTAAQIFARFSPLRQTFINQIAALLFGQQSLQSYFDELADQYYAGTQNPVVCVDCACQETYCDDMVAGLGAMSHECSVTYPFAVGGSTGAFNGTNGGTWQNTDGRNGIGGAMHPVDIDNNGFYEVSVVIDLLVEKTVSEASFWYKHLAAPVGASDQFISFYDDTKTLIVSNNVNHGNVIEYTQCVWAGSVSGVRYIAMQAWANLGTQPVIDDICATYK